MRWQDCKDTEATRAAMRAAAAGVAGVHTCGWCSQSGNSCGTEAFRPDRNRDDFARVVLAASARYGPMPHTSRTDQSPWTTALRDCFKALGQLLDLLQIPVPGDLNDE